VLAFGSDEVSQAFIAAHQADSRVYTALQERAEAASFAGAYPPGANPAPAGVLAAEIRALREAADQADRTLIELVRRELQGRARTRWWRFGRVAAELQSAETTPGAGSGDG
jgi:hypothetical protein